MRIGKIVTWIFTFVLFMSIVLAQETPPAPQPPQEPGTQAASVPSLSFLAAVIDSARANGVMMAETNFRGGVDSPVAKPSAENSSWFQATMQIKIAFGVKPRIGLLVNGINAVDSKGQKHKLVGVAFKEEENKNIFMAIEQFEGRAKTTIDAKTMTFDVLWGVYLAKNAGDCMVLAANENNETVSPEKLKEENPLLLLVKNATQIKVTLLFQVPASSRISSIQLMPGKEIKIQKPKSTPLQGTKKKT